MNDCPYGAESCPKIAGYERRMDEMQKKLNMIIALVAILHGTEIIGLMSGVF